MISKPARAYPYRLVFWAFILGVLVLSCNLPMQLTAAATPTPEISSQDMMATAVAGTLQSAAANTPEPPAEFTPTVEPPTETVTATLTLTPTIVHLTQPGEPPTRESWMFDSDSSTTAAERRASRGEYYQINFLERPFNANSMDTYFPDLDIKEASLARGGGWVYVTIKLVGQRSGGGLQGTYGAELDLNLDGRGDWLILATAPGASWSTDRVKVYQDSNRDVGDGSPNLSDPPQNGDGYETLVFDQGLGSDPDAAWARVAPGDANSAQIAFKYSLIGSDAEFLWGAWADQGLVNPGWFDYIDHFSHEEAGSPISGLPQYPLKAVAELDNTCRWPVGFNAVGDEPGVCPVPATATPTIVPGRISGKVFHDGNGDLVYQSGEIGIEGARVRLRSGTCGSPGGTIADTETNSSGNYSFSGLAPGDYCVDVPSDPTRYVDKSGPATVELDEGESGHANFGYFWFG
jgi:hypothetical protein